MKIQKIVVAVVAGVLASSAMIAMASADSKSIELAKSDVASYTFVETSTSGAGGTSLTAGWVVGYNVAASVVSGLTPTGVVGSATYDPSGSKSTTGLGVESPLATLDIPVAAFNTNGVYDLKGKKIEDALFDVATGAVTTKIFKFSSKNSTTTYIGNGDATITLNGSGEEITGLVPRATERQKIGNAGEVTLTATFVDSLKSSDIKVLYGGSPTTEKVDANGKWTAKIGVGYEDKTLYFDVNSISFQDKDGNAIGNKLVSLVLSYDDAAPAASTPATQAPDITNPDDAVVPDDGGATAPDGTTNPNTGIVFAVIPAIVSAAAAVVSKKK